MPVEYAAVHLASELEDSRRAQMRWAARPIDERLSVLRRFRTRFVEQSADFLALFAPELRRTASESITAEIIPLADACRFLERHAEKMLRPKRLENAGRPFWMRSVEIEVRREAIGVVLIIAPANYPLFLPGVQTLQALAAGNAIVWKPGRGGTALAHKFRELLLESGLPEGLVQVLDDTFDSAHEAIACGVDKIVLTGSEATGRVVYRSAASALTPVVMELSGEDVVFIRPGADIERAVRATIFAAALNNGNTCIAPRLIVVWSQVAAAFEEAWNKLCPHNISIPVRHPMDDYDALQIAAASRFALGATIFGEQEDSKRFAQHVNAGVVVVNDAIVPTADPRLPFGGRQRSGFGTTRGEAGLLELTSIKAIAVQKSTRLRHLEPQPPNSQELFLSYLSTVHCDGWRARLAGFRALARALYATARKDRSH